MDAYMKLLGHSVEGANLDDLIEKFPNTITELEVHKLPQKVGDHDMCILQKCVTKLTKKAKIYLQIIKIDPKNPKLV